MPVRRSVESHSTSQAQASPGWYQQPPVQPQAFQPVQSAFQPVQPPVPQPQYTQMPPAPVMHQPVSQPGQMPGVGMQTSQGQSFQPQPQAQQWQPGGIEQQMASMMAAQVAGQVQEAAFARWFPQLSFALKMHFNVDHAFVLRKLFLLFCPFPLVLRKGAQGEPSWRAQEPMSGNMGSENLKTDINDTDLYIPLMSFVTYVVVYGMQRGTVNTFEPGVLSSTASFATSLLILEVGAAKFALYVVGSTAAAMDLVANCGYKFVPLVVMVLCRIALGGTLYYILFMYLAAAAAMAVRHFMLHAKPAQTSSQHQGIADHPLAAHVVTVLSVAQVPLCWLLTPSGH